MATTLRYNFVGSAEENGVLTVGFADDQSEPQEYLMFQNWLDASEVGEDDEIYIERDGQQHGTYGGIERLVLSRDQALMWLSPETAKAINTEQEVTIIFSATDKQFQQLKADLEHVFAGTQSLELR